MKIMNTNKREEDQYKDDLIHVINKHVPHCALYLFGSRAQQTNTPRSDIDLAIDAGKELSIGTIENIKEEIETLNIHLFVDIVDVHAVEDRLKNHILKSGILWQQKI